MAWSGGAFGFGLSAFRRHSLTFAHPLNLFTNGTAIRILQAVVSELQRGEVSICGRDPILPNWYSRKGTNGC
jgi:hypothetical protein